MHISFIWRSRKHRADAEQSAARPLAKLFDTGYNEVVII